MNWSRRRHGSRQEGWSPTWPVPICLRSRPSQALPSLWCNVSSAKNCSSESVSSESVNILIKRAPRSCCHVHSVMQNPRWLFEDVQGDANDDYSRIRTATGQDCIFLCICVGEVAILVKQCNPSQQSCRLHTPLVQGFRVVLLTGVSDPDSSQRYSFQ